MSDRDTLLDLLSAPSTTDSIEAPARFAGRYRVVSLVGVGGMGAVYRVEDDKLGEVVALKLLKGAGPEIAARLRSEVVMARRVTHPNVVRIFDLGEDGEQLFLTMEYVAGESLGTVLQQTGPLAPRQVLTLGRQLASAAGAAHRAGVLHRDLKPDNVLIAEGSPLRAVLTDFGIAQAVAGGRGVWAGTPAWMAPEQRRGGSATERSEVWALGAILYEALTGELASAGIDPSQLPAQLAPVLLRCLDADPQARFGSMDLLGAALAEVAAVSQPPAAVRRVAAPSARVLHVAPLRMVGPPDAAYLAEGVTEEIADALEGSPGLSITRGPERDVRAEAVIEGSLRWTGAGPIRLGIRLVTVGSEQKVWARKVSCTAEELLAQGELLAREVADALTVDRPSRALSRLSEADAAEYFQIRATLRDAWQDDLKPAADRLVALATRHPTDPAVLSLLALVRSRQAFVATAEEQGLHDLAQSAAIRAIRADRSRGESWLALGQTLMYRGHTVQAAAALRRAVAAAPGSAEVHRMLGYLLVEVGRVEEAVPHLERAIADSSLFEARQVLARALAFSGDWERARSVARELAERDEAGAAYMLSRLWIWGYEPVRAEALEAVKRVVPDDIPDDVPLTSMTSATVGVRGLLQGQDIPYERMVEASTLIDAQGSARMMAARSQFIGEFTGRLGHVDLTLEVLGKGVDSGLEDLQWLDHCGALDSVRNTDAFTVLRERVARRVDGIVAALDGDPATEAALDALVAGG